MWYKLRYQSLALVLTFYRLTENKISDDGARALSRALEVNQSLHKLE